MKTAIILHGTLGSPEGNWFRWLRGELEDKGITVWLPQLPRAEQPSLRMWWEFVKNECPLPIDNDTLIVGHSSGAILALVIAQNNPEKIGAIVDVSVFHNNSLNWEPNSKLFDIEFDWTAIQQSADKLLFIHSDNDPYVPLEQAKYVADRCAGELVVVPGQGHFNLEQSSSYAEFPYLLETLQREEIL
ncbi:MAG: alpha/beta hydrolase [Candidatus Saccharimonas sp.]